MRMSLSQSKSANQSQLIEIDQFADFPIPNTADYLTPADTDDVR